MLKGIYSAAAGMVGELMRQDVTADNLANISTIGYKSTSTSFKSFSEALIQRMDGGGADAVGKYARASAINNTWTQFAQGDIIQTGNPLDVAVRGEGFMAIKRPMGEEMYTRGGSFTRDTEGFMVNMDGLRVQSENGDISIPATAKKIEISGTGEVSVDGVTAGRIKLVKFEDPQQLERAGGSLYKANGQTPEPAGNVSFEQGALERANINVITGMVNNLTGLRIYETLQKSIQMQNETLGKAVNEVGRV